MLILRLFKESYLFALQSLLSNKLQTTLSLLGITIGIFSVISVFTLIDSLEYKIRNSINSMGNNIIYVQKWPWMFGEDYPWWKYYQRPEPSIKDAEVLRRNLKGANQVGFMMSTNKTIYYDNQQVDNVATVGASIEYDQLFEFDFEAGRYFTPLESASGKPVIIIGAEIASVLFEGQEAIGEKVKIFGRKLTVIGVFKRQGEDMFGNSHDKRILIPINYVRNVVNLRSGRINPSLMVIGQKGVPNGALKDNIRGVLRASHRLRPTQDDDFSINEMAMLSSNFDGIFKTIGIAGWFIGGLSLLVGGFGIANIMFVSVRERTSQIGIQKALGAKNFFILLQFLFESVFLSLFGGLLGLFIVFGAVQLAQSIFEFELIMSFSNIMLGIMVSLLIGLAAGVIPAIMASKMSPVEAMRSV
jgi:putative ABC transport system permease protein